MTIRVYPLGNTEAEHERLSRQANVHASFTERVFRNAGIKTGQRVLDLGSGAGDVAMLIAGIVGSSGEVIGVERSSKSVARARERVQKAGLRNVSFVEADVYHIPPLSPFDAAVGRYILEFVPDPIAIVRSIAERVKAGGVVAFLEPSWKTMLLFCEHLSVRLQAATIAHETLLRAGADTEMGLKLYRIFQAAGLPSPRMEMETVILDPTETGRWLRDFLRSLEPQMQRLGISADAVGDLETLADRIKEEAEVTNAVVPLTSLIGAWCTK